MLDLFKKVRLTTKLHSFSKAKVQLFLIGGDFFGKMKYPQQPKGTRQIYYYTIN